MDERWFFGLDGGGTSCRLRVEKSDASLVWKDEAGPANPRSVGWEETRRVVSGLFARLYADTGLIPANCAGGFAGMAGIGRPADRQSMVDIVREAARVSCPLEADNDALPALVGALGAPEGILLISGTGSVVLGALPEGTLVRAGGWGHILGDEGSAYDVGRRGLDAAIRCFEGRGPETALLERALAYFEISDAFDLIPAVYERFDKSKIAGFSREVSAAARHGIAREGDTQALAILSAAAEDLCALVFSVAARLPGTPAFGRIAFSGGFIERETFLKTRVEALIAEALPGWRVVPGAGEASRGACELARRLARR